MDASGESLFVIDLKTGEWFCHQFTKEEQELFNKFDIGEGATTINQRELLSELFAVVLQGPLHAKPEGRLLNLINDNRTAQHRTDGSSHRDSRDDQILSIIGLLECAFRLTCVGSRVATDENFADYGTRLIKDGKFCQGLKVLERVYGWEAKELDLPTWLSDVGWRSLDLDLSERDWYSMALKCLEDIEDRFPGKMERCCGIEQAHHKLAAALKEAANLSPLPPAPPADGDFPTKGKSRQRRAATVTMPKTQNTLYRELSELSEETIFTANGQWPMAKSLAD